MTDIELALRAAAQSNQQMPMQVAQPINDVQLIALVAAGLSDPGQTMTALERVTKGMEIVAEAIYAMKANRLAGIMRAIHKRETGDDT